jgi:hypothetical protein
VIVASVVSSVVLLLVVVGITFTYASRYQPIQFEVGMEMPMAYQADGTPDPDAVKDVPDSNPLDPFNRWPTPMVTSTEPNFTIRVSNLIINRGRYSVEVLAVDTPFGSRAPRLDLRMGNGHGSPAVQPFRKFTLRPGDIRVLRTVLRPRICPGADDRSAAAVARAQNITYRFLGTTHHTMVEFTGSGYGIRGIVSC